MIRAGLRTATPPLVGMLSFALALTVGASGCAAAPGGPPESMNLVVLSIDTLRPDHLGLYGYDRATSPRIDAFADRCVVFDQAVTVHVTTAPTHATILTGRFPAGHGILRNGMRLNDGVPTLAEIFSELGWATGAFVSGWTLQRHTGLDRGFELYDDQLDAPGAGARRDGALTTNRALGWVDQQVVLDRPFFLFLHLFEPHWPYEPEVADALGFLPGQGELTTLGKPVHIDRRLSSNQLAEAEQREYVARYDGEIVTADRLVGRFLDRLEALGVAENTVIVLLSDHGETLFEREWAMDHGTRPYDEQARVPLLVRLPRDELAGTRVAAQASLLSIAVTVLDIFDIDPPDGLEGRSLVPVARGEDGDGSVRPAVITARAEPRRVPHIGAELSDHGLVRAIRLPGIKLIEYPMSESRWHPELFDLSIDAGETTDLSSERRATVQALHRELSRLAAPLEAGAALQPALSPEVEDALRELGYIDEP